MPDLRRQVLESGKTVSRKAKSKQASTASSRLTSGANSRTASKNPSRAGSDEEEGGNFSDETSFRYEHLSVKYHASSSTTNWLTHRTSVNSVDDIVGVDDIDEAAAWTSRLSERIDEVIDRKRSSNEGREAALSEYIRFLTARYVGEDLQGRETDLLSAFAKSIKQETSEKETILALKGTLPFFSSDNRS